MEIFSWQGDYNWEADVRNLQILIAAIPLPVNLIMSCDDTWTIGPEDHQPFWARLQPEGLSAAGCWEKRISFEFEAIVGGRLYQL
jgi:hypothetical protein